MSMGILKTGHQKIALTVYFPVKGFIRRLGITYVLDI